jgi:hypothetical protein
VEGSDRTVVTNKSCNDLCGQGDPGNQDFEQEAARHWNVRSGGVWRILCDWETRQTAIGSLCLSDFANGSDLLSLADRGPIVLGPDHANKDKVFHENPRHIEPIPHGPCSLEQDF